GVRPEEAVYIGDSDVDIATAKNAGLGGVFVDYGFRSRDFLIRNGGQEYGTIVSTTREAGDVILGA
ncbi:MAG: HAD family hydrolase, partial [Lachnospiraceae bacterium]|nr:HAD family hydrolase [Lachnospiraceae bacterium]